MMEIINWRALRADPGQYDMPDWIDAASSPAPMPAPVPGTVASLILGSHPQPLDHLSNIDQFDWWYSAEFDRPKTGTQHFLIFDGLATLTDIWLNGELLLQTDNMFREYRVNVTAKLQPKNQLVICFRSLHKALEANKKRPKWKTKLVEQQNLRWFRTTLLGYIPGWTPPVKPVGIWREVRLESVEVASLNDYSLQTSLQNDHGIIKLKADIDYVGDQPCEILFEFNGQTHSLFSGSASIIQLDKEITIPGIHAWMPHTHGTPTLYQCRLMLRAGGQVQVMQEARIGFRQVELDQENGLFQIKVNGRSVFARGAVWTVSDIVSLNGDLKTALILARDAGMNMLRVGGTMTYERDEFYDLCDELGVMVWQDFMFANMDYPVKDEAFHENILTEATQQLKRLGIHACVVAYCGNSEVEQQAAMLGIPSEMWRNDWFGSELPALIQSLHTNSIYVPSSPSGGTLPFYTSTGVTHYYGVGAYLRDVSDVRRANVKFTPECLGFSNVPDDVNIAKRMGDLSVSTHHPHWKKGVPRDNGAGWDFEDVRDHYAGELFGINPVQLRSADTERYLALSRVVSGEMMSQVFSEWRSSYSQCGGGLVWFYKDLVPGAGWGVLDSENRPKAAYYFLKRVFQPVAVLITDEGLQGLHLHLVNETPERFHGMLEFCMLRDGHVMVANVKREVFLEAGQLLTLHAEEMLGGFYDTAYAYRFGAPKHEVACVTLRDEEGNVVSQQFHFPLRQLPVMVTPKVEGRLSEIGNGLYQLTLHSDRFLYAVEIQCEDHLPSDNYFHLMPNESRVISLLSISVTASGAPNIHIRSINTQGIDLI